MRTLLLLTTAAIAAHGVWVDRPHARTRHARAAPASGANGGEALWRVDLGPALERFPELEESLRASIEARRSAAGIDALGVERVESEAWTDAERELAISLTGMVLSIPPSLAREPAAAVRAALESLRERPTRGDAREVSFSFESLADHARARRGLEGPRHSTSMVAQAALGRDGRIRLVRLDCTRSADRLDRCEPILRSFALSLAIGDRVRLTPAPAIGGVHVAAGAAGLAVLVAGLIAFFRRDRQRRMASFAE